MNTESHIREILLCQMQTLAIRTIPYTLKYIVCSAHGAHGLFLKTKLINDFPRHITGCNDIADDDFLAFSSYQCNT